ncbi:MAG TPA: N-acetylmuramic acid 6-phosphate etherase [Roseiarcus sp.]|jgi:N-acetylmuramic acid 6-phosphate etherase|nr:N-acetylmuramic acid 6-phosphate etherase [Roseiarcus sp.]
MRTEDHSSRFEDLDAWSSLDAIHAMFEGQLSAVAAVRAALPSIVQAGEAAAARLAEGGRLVYAGAGTSGRIGVQDGAELAPTFDWPEERVVFAIAGGERALRASSEGAEDDRDAARRALAHFTVAAHDVAVGLAASGATPYTVEFIRGARDRGTLTVAIANNPGAPLLEAAEHAILVETGPEVLAGSTRMKAGTAQKVVINLFSTLVMIRLGRVYRGLMVDMRPRNAKLLRRAMAMISHLAHCDEETAKWAFDAADGEVKVAVLLARGIDVETAKTLIRRSRGHLRSVLAHTKA